MELPQPDEMDLRKKKKEKGKKENFELLDVYLKEMKIGHQRNLHSQITITPCGYRLCSSNF